MSRSAEGQFRTEFPGQPIARNSKGQTVQEECRQQLGMPYLNAYLSGVVKRNL